MKTDLADELKDADDPELPEAVLAVSSNGHEKTKSKSRSGTRTAKGQKGSRTSGGGKCGRKDGGSGVDQAVRDEKVCPFSGLILRIVSN